MHAVTLQRRQPHASWLSVALTALSWLPSACATDPSPATTGNPANAAPAAGAGAGITAANDVAAQTPAATFTQVYEMFFPRTTNAHCDMCHGLPPYDLSNGNLSTGKDRASTYAALVGKASTSSMCMGRVFVVPNHPEMSLLLQKLLPNPPCGFRMPNGGAALTDSQVEMVRSWIAAGAKDD